MNQHIIFNGWTCKLQFDHYRATDGVSIQLIDADDHSPVAKATQCVPDMHDKLAEGCVFIRSLAENVGLLEALEASHIVERTGRVSPDGFHEAKLLIPVPERQA